MLVAFVVLLPWGSERPIFQSKGAFTAVVRPCLHENCRLTFISFYSVHL